MAREGEGKEEEELQVQFNPWRSNNRYRNSGGAIDRAQPYTRMSPGTRPCHLDIPQRVQDMERIGPCHPNGRRQQHKPRTGMHPIKKPKQDSIRDGKHSNDYLGNDSRE